MSSPEKKFEVVSFNMSRSKEEMYRLLELTKEKLNLALTLKPVQMTELSSMKENGGDFVQVGKVRIYLLNIAQLG